MNTPDIIRSFIDLALIAIAVFLLCKEHRVAAWERRTARKLLRWAVRNIPSFRVWLYGEGDATHMPVKLIEDWRNNHAK